MTDFQGINKIIEGLEADKEKLWIEYKNLPLGSGYRAAEIEKETNMIDAKLEALREVKKGVETRVRKLERSIANLKEWEELTRVLEGERK